MKKTLVTLATAAALSAPAFAQDVAVEIEKDMLATDEGRNAVLGLLEEEARDACLANFRVGARGGTISACTAELFEQLTQSLAEQVGDDGIAFLGASQR